MSVSNKILGSAKSIWGKGGFFNGSGIVTSTSSKALNAKLETPASAKNFILNSPNKFVDNENYTNPEDLLCASHTACLVITFSSILGKYKYEATHIEADAKCTMEIRPSGFIVTNMDLHLNAIIPNIEIKKFEELALMAKEACPISKLMSGNVNISLKSTLNKTDC
ncbi:hypothetical protein RB653_007185 [Dictyostelium firmibasis]|uniref:Uncharacterized protein n=1 Tax=Dictyostelium firmibasis TaxID=79012 RepID=A0AAN7TLC9_9MYCE